jgi:hypothetical protein
MIRKNDAFNELCLQSIKIEHKIKTCANINIYNFFKCHSNGWVYFAIKNNFVIKLSIGNDFILI